MRHLFFTVIILLLSTGAVAALLEDSRASARKERGVYLYDSDRAFSGLNLFCSRVAPTAALLDMEGREVHRWEKKGRYKKGWHHVEPGVGGVLYVVTREDELLKLDWDSNILWSLKGRFHHDVAVSETGDIYALMREEKTITHNGTRFPVLDEVIAVISPDGVLKKKFGLFDLAKHLVPPERLTQVERFLRRNKRRDSSIDHNTIANIFHANAIEHISRPIKGIAEKGDLLVSFRELNTVVVVDLTDKKIVWHWGAGVIDRQHHPTFLDNGNLLVFDNGWVNKHSRVIEIEPRTEAVVWEYGTGTGQQFFSERRGGSQRLPNGNTLVTVAEDGVVFEVTGEGKIVWRYVSTLPTKAERRIYRMTRIVNPENFLPIEQE